MKMESIFSEINSGKVKDEQSNYSEKLYDYLHKLIEINNYPIIASYFDPQVNNKESILMKWKKKLTYYFNEIEEKINQFRITHSTANVLSHLEVIKTMSCFDEYLNNGEESFTKLYRVTLNSLYSSVGDILTRFNEALNIYDYDTAHKILIDLEQSEDSVNKHYLDKCKIILSLNITNLIEQTQNLSTKYFYSASDDRSNETVLSQVVSNLKRMNRMIILEHYLPSIEKDNEKSLSERKAAILSRIEEGLIEQMKEISVYLRADNFPKAAQYVKAIKSKFEILDYHCSETLQRSLKEEQEKFKKSLETLIETFREKDVVDYRVRPPNELIVNLEKDPTYFDTIETLERIILDKFRGELNLLKCLKRKVRKLNKTDETNNNQSVVEQESITLNTRERALRQLESIATSCLPKKLSDIVNADIKFFKEDIDYEQSIERKDIQQAIESENLQAIGDVYKRNVNLGNHEVLAKVDKFVQDKISKYCNNIIEIISTEIEKATMNAEFSDSMERLLECIKFSFEFNIKLISKQPYELVNKLKSHIERILLCLEKLFDSNHDLSESLKSTNKVPNIDYNQAFLFVKTYVSIEQRNKSATVKHVLELPKFEQRFNELIRKIFDAALTMKKNFNESIDNWNLSSIRSILNKMQNWDTILEDIKTSKQFDFVKRNELDLDYGAMKMVVVDKIKELKKSFEKFQLITEATKTSDFLRNMYFQDLKNKLEIVKHINDLDVHVSSSISVIYLEMEITSILEAKWEAVSKSLEESIENLEKGKVNEPTCKSIYINYVHLESFVLNAEFVKDKGTPIINSMKQRTLETIDTISNNLLKSANVETVADELIKMKTAADAIPVFKELVDKKIDESLIAYKQKSPPNVISKLGTMLNGSTIGKVIINEHSIFEGFALAAFSKKVAPHDIDYVLANLDGNSLSKEKLRHAYDCYLYEYNRLLKKHLQKHVDFELLTAEINMVLGKSKDQGIWNVKIIGLVPELIAYVFLIWTLKKASLYFEAKDLDDAEYYLRRPHPAQVVAILRLLSVGDDDQKLQHNLCEVGTGEGKSVILAVTASIFALCGYDVSCVCYSKYLSERDYNDFQIIFDTLEIGERIRYGTFNEISEHIINEDGIVRDMIKNQISGLPLALKSKKKQRLKILLIDEVDVFLKSDFYGNLYRPIARLNHKSVKPLIQYIWNNRSRNLNINTIKATTEYKECCNSYRNWEFLIEESIKNLLLDLQTFNKPAYVVKNDKIGYVEQDAVSFQTVYGYKTLFAYFAEHEKGRITQTSLDENVYLQVKCGNFSYSEIPNKFKFIMGVTGTLKTLTEPEKNIIESEYKILKKTYLPSVFGANQLTFIPQNDVHVENSHDYHKKIATEILYRLSGKLEGTKRAVLVFFDSKDSLMKFYNSEAFLSMRHQTKILTEEDNLTMKEKDLFVKDATRSGVISLITKSFGRGTDFVSRDDIVISNGGVHVILTFLSEQYSEEVQIKGRTARQGDPGSFSMILLDEDLEKYSITLDDISANKANIYDFIHHKRNDYFVKHYNSDKEFKEFIQTEHQKSVQLLESIKAGDVKFIKGYLKETNKGAEMTLLSKTLCLMDATGSMGGLLIQAKNKVHEMFKDAVKILEDAKMNPNCFQIQFGVYRDYDCGIREILELSPWETKPDDLFSFMSKIHPKGGGDYEEAIEIALRYANLEFDSNNITQVILIGDAPAKRPDQITNYRKQYGGESLWNTHFGSATDYKTEALKLNAKNVPVHAFYLHEGARRNFQEISSQTGGLCEYLDVSKENSKHSLGYLVTHQLLANIGQACGKGNKLAEKYMQQFTRAHIDNR